MNSTLTLYVARRFLAYFAYAFVAVFMVVVLVDMVELLRKSARSDATFAEVLWLAVLHAPSLMLTILPFIALLAAMACFSSLARSSELVVTRAAGVSVWRLLGPTLCAAALLGAAAFGIFNPIAAGTLQRFETLKAKYFDDATSLLSISSEGMWLRQKGPEGQEVIRAWRANRDGTQLWDVTVFQFDESDRLVGRVKAARAVLTDGAWTLHQVNRWTFDPGSRAMHAEEESEDTYSIATDLTQEHILESFSTPETISFWALPRFIGTLESAGFSATRHRMFWQSQLAQPMLLAAMVLIGAAFSMRHVRFGGLGLMALAAVLTGLGYFFLANVTQAFGNSGAVAPPLAAWIPPVAMALFAIGLLLHLEDG